jgi:hypothetical protein
LKTAISRDDFLNDRQGRTFRDVLNDSEQPFGEALEFFSDPDRQRRMEESEIHHDRAPLAGVVRELESLPGINGFLGSDNGRRNQRLRQAIGVLVRIVMEQRGWKKTGRKGSLGVRSKRVRGTPNHNTGGLAFWFLRAERYEPADGIEFLSVRKRCRSLESSGARRGKSAGRGSVAKRAIDETPSANGSKAGKQPRNRRRKAL